MLSRWLCFYVSFARALAGGPFHLRCRDVFDRMETDCTIVIPPKTDETGDSYSIFLFNGFILIFALCSAFNWHSLPKIIACKHSHTFRLDLITNPCHKLNNGFIKPPLKLGHGWVITYPCVNPDAGIAHLSKMTPGGNSIPSQQIATKFALVTGVILPCQTTRIWVRTKLNYHRIWVATEKSFEKWVLGPQDTCALYGVNGTVCLSIGCWTVWSIITISLISVSWGQHGVHLGPTGPRWAPRWPHELCYLGYFPIVSYLITEGVQVLSYGIKLFLSDWKYSNLSIRRFDSIQQNTHPGSCYILSLKHGLTEHHVL